MRDNYLCLIAATTLALALAGCGGGGGGGGANLPPADNVLPDEVPNGTTAGIEDYLVPFSGTWRVNMDGLVAATAFGNSPLTAALVYDSDTDQWILNAAGANSVLDFVGQDIFGDVYATVSCTDRCADMLVFDDNPAASQYGTFAYIAYYTSTQLTEYFAHYGLKTRPAVMPVSGTGFYAGTFLGLVNSTVGFDYVEGSADVTANFGTGAVTFDSVDSGLDPNYSYILTGNATISGNSYSGTVSGSYTTASGTANFNTAGSTLSGAFYGPAADETAGVIYSSGANGEIAGGFWAN